ncbi:hypothetical protein LINPERPRIM_LOCUS19369 [Linum perenne]
MQTLSMISPSSSSSSMTTVRASWDTQQRLSYNRNAPRNPDKKKLTAETVPTSNSARPPSVPKLTLTPHSVSELLKRNVKGKGVVEDVSDSYLGYDVWLPRPPKVEKPRSAFNAATLAYIGDGIYEDALLQKLKDEDFLSTEERGILKWGKNVGSAKTRTRRRAGSAVYNRASSLETLVTLFLVGYLYLTDVNRLDEVMQKLGFSAGSSAEKIVHENSVPGEQADEICIKAQ